MFDARPLDLPPYRGVIAAAFDRPAIMAALSDLPGLLSSPAAEILHSGRNKIAAVRLPAGGESPEAESGRSSSSGKTSVAAPISGLPGRESANFPDPPFTSGTDEAVVKIFGARGVHKLKTLVLPSKGLRAWHGAVALLEGGFETPGPIAAFERRRSGVAVESVFIAGRVHGGSEIRELFRGLPEPESRRLISDLAPVLAGLHAAGLVHRDLSDGNILVIDPTAVSSSSRLTRIGEGWLHSPPRNGSKSPGASVDSPEQSAVAIAGSSAPPATAMSTPSSPGFRFLFLDTNRVRRRRMPGPFGRARNLVRLGVPKTLQSFFLDQYAAAAGPAFPRARFGFHYRTAKRSFEFWLAFKKAARLRSLARKLGLQ